MLFRLNWHQSHLIRSLSSKGILLVNKRDIKTTADTLMSKGGTRAT